MTNNVEICRKKLVDFEEYLLYHFFIKDERGTYMEQLTEKTKYCKYCASVIPEDAVICKNCGRQVEQLKSEQPQVVVNNTNNNTNTNVNRNYNGSGRYGAKNKWVALLLCFFLGGVGAHKFYEGKILLGLVYIFTAGLFGIGWFVDFIILLFKPNPYYP